MACFRPLRAYKVPGGVSFSEKDAGSEIRLPCGKCAGCRLEHSRQWAVRCVHEAKMHELNCALTLTYSKDHLPSGGSLRYEDFQGFMKRLRKFVSPVRVRYFACGEYGEVGYRPHYHALIFGMDFLDKKLWKKTDAGSLIYRSKVLERLWPLGHSSVGEMNFQSAAYVARYAMKKLNGDVVDSRSYGRVDLRSGEILPLVAEFIHMSLKPGIGRAWIEKYVDDVYAFDRVVVNGVETKPPRYYDKFVQVKHPFAWRDIAFDREEKALSRAADQTDARLDVRRVVLEAQLLKFRRDLK